MTGPYLNEDGDWWVPVEDGSFAQARAWVVQHLSYDIPGDGRLAYKGTEKTSLCDGDHSPGPECDATCSKYVLAYHFEERRLW